MNLTIFQGDSSVKQFLTHMKNVSLCNDHCYAGRVSVLGENFNIVVFSDNINMINVKFCMLVVLIESYPFIPLSVTLIVFQGHSSVKYFLMRLS